MRATWIVFWPKRKSLLWMLLRPRSLSSSSGASAKDDTVSKPLSISCCRMRPASFLPTLCGHYSDDIMHSGREQHFIFPITITTTTCQIYAPCTRHIPFNAQPRYLTSAMPTHERNAVLADCCRASKGCCGTA